MRRMLVACDDSVFADVLRHIFDHTTGLVLRAKCAVRWQRQSDFICQDASSEVGHQLVHEDQVVLACERHEEGLMLLE